METLKTDPVSQKVQAIGERLEGRLTITKDSDTTFKVVDKNEVVVDFYELDCMRQIAIKTIEALKKNIQALEQECKYNEIKLRKINELNKDIVKAAQIVTARKEKALAESKIKQEKEKKK